MTSGPGKRGGSGRAGRGRSGWIRRERRERRAPSPVPEDDTQAGPYLRGSMVSAIHLHTVVWPRESNRFSVSYCAAMASNMAVTKRSLGVPPSWKPPAGVAVVHGSEAAAESDMMATRARAATSPWTERGGAQRPPCAAARTTARSAVAHAPTPSPRPVSRPVRHGSRLRLIWRGATAAQRARPAVVPGGRGAESEGATPRCAVAGGRDRGGEAGTSAAACRHWKRVGAPRTRQGRPPERAASGGSSAAPGGCVRQRARDGR